MEIILVWYSIFYVIIPYCLYVAVSSLQTTPVTTAKQSSKTRTHKRYWSERRIESKRNQQNMKNVPLDLKPNDWFPWSKQAFFITSGTALALFQPYCNMGQITILLPLTWLGVNSITQRDSHAIWVWKKSSNASFYDFLQSVPTIIVQPHELLPPFKENFQYIKSHQYPATKSSLHFFWALLLLKERIIPNQRI